MLDLVLLSTAWAILGLPVIQLLMLGPGELDTVDTFGACMIVIMLSLLGPFSFLMFTALVVIVVVLMQKRFGRIFVGFSLRMFAVVLINLVFLLYFVFSLSVDEVSVPGFAYLGASVLIIAANMGLYHSLSTRENLYHKN